MSEATKLPALLYSASHDRKGFSMDEDEDGFQFAPNQRQNSVQKAGLNFSLVLGIALVPIGILFIVVLAAKHENPVFGIVAVAAGVLLTFGARSFNRDQKRK
jgi:hypothetical protein